VEKKQQPDVADLLEPGYRITTVERRQQFQHAACGRRQAGLTGDSELLFKAGADIADRRDAVIH